MIFTRIALARFFTLLAIRIIPIRDFDHGATYGAYSRLWQANDRLKFRLNEMAPKQVSD